MILTRPYLDTDEDACLALFSRAYGAEMSRETWRWKYRGSPDHRPGMSRVVVREDGALVAHFGVVPVPFNVAGNRYTAGMLTDLAVAPEERGSSLGSKLFYSVHGASAEQGFPLSVSYPSDMALGPLHLLCRRVLMLEKYALRIGGEGHARLRARIDGRPEDERMAFDFEPRYALDARVDGLWASLRKLESLSVWKDRAYLAWRYGAQPGRAHELYALTSGDVLAGLCVASARRGALVIHELFARDKAIWLAHELLLRVADHAREQSLAELRFAGWDSWFFAEVFADFERRPSYSRHVFARASRSDEAFLYENALNWTVTSGDAEAF